MKQWTKTQKARILKKVLLEQAKSIRKDDKYMIREYRKGKIRLRPVIKQGLTSDDRKLSGFKKLGVKKPVCHNCKFEMEHIEGNKWGCRICENIVKIPTKWSMSKKKRKKSKISQKKINIELLEQNKIKLGKAVYTGRAYK